MKIQSRQRFILGLVLTAVVLFAGSEILPRLDLLNLWGLCYLRTGQKGLCP